jgi:hypothetical protein
MIFAGIFTIHTVAIRDFLQKRLNPQSPKSAASTLEPIRDVVPSDFFLIGDLKEKLCGTSFITSDDPIIAIRQTFSEIPDMFLKIVFPNWIRKLVQGMKKGGKCYTEYINANQIIVLV